MTTHHIAIEIAACAPTCDAGILAVGAVSFDLKGKIKARFYEEVEPYYAQRHRRFDPATMLKMVTDRKTMARLAAPAEKVYGLPTVLDNLASWFGNAAQGLGAHVWARNTHLTIAALDHAYHNNVVGRSSPWKSNNVCDLSTLIVSMPSGLTVASSVSLTSQPKNAEEDAELVALTVVNLLGTPVQVKQAAKVKPADDDEL